VCGLAIPSLTVADLRGLAPQWLVYPEL